MTNLRDTETLLNTAQIAELRYMYSVRLDAENPAEGGAVGTSL